MKTTPISENLKKMLEDRGYKQKYLANQLNTSDRVVRCVWLTHSETPPLQTSKPLAYR